MLENNNIVAHYDFLLCNWLSGGTILSILLNNHRQITCNGETLPFPDQTPEELVCSCSKPLTECEFYRYAANHFISDNTFDRRNFSRLPFIFDTAAFQRIFTSFNYPRIRDLISNLTPDYKEKITYFIKSHEKFFNLACKYDKSSVYLDGVKSIRRVELFAKYGSKPIRVLHSIRDGRKFVASSIKAYQLSGKQISRAARDWVDYIRMVEELQRRHPQIKLKEVRHEDLCHNTENTIKDICDFLGVDYDPDIFSFEGSSYHVLGNYMRKSFDGNIVENDKWKSVYTDELFDKVTKIQKHYLIKYNYL